jgi:hypothetical protein
MGALSQIPRDQARFIDRAALNIMQAGSRDIESVLQRIVDYFSSKEYGWEEAVLDQKWYRYPGEIRRQRFCSEEALKNYLICRALSLPARYYIAENWHRGNMHHELVLLEYEGTTYLVDWDLHKVRIEPDRLVTSCGSKAYFSRLTEISEYEVAGRVEALRNSEMLLDSLKNGQYLYTKYSDRGKLDAYVKYFEGRKQLEFTFIFYNYSGLHNFYFIHRLNKAGKTLKEEIGYVVEKNGFRLKKIPMMKIDVATGKKIFFPIDGRFDMVSRRQFCYVILHDTYLYEDRTVGKLKVLRESIRAFDKWKDDKKEHPEWRSICRWIVHHYNDLMMRTPRGAQCFLESNLLQLWLKEQFPKYSELRNIIGNRTGCRNINSISKAYLTVNCLDLSKLLVKEDTLNTQRLLCEAVAKKLGITAIEFKPGKIFKLVEELAYKTIWQNQYAH